MKKKIYKVAIGLFFIGTLIANFSIGEKVSIIMEAEAGLCGTYCPNSGAGCIIVFANGTMTTCVGGHTQPL